MTWIKKDDKSRKGMVTLMQVQSMEPVLPGGSRGEIYCAEIYLTLWSGSGITILELFSNSSLTFTSE